MKSRILFFCFFILCFLLFAERDSLKAGSLFDKEITRYIYLQIGNPYMTCNDVTVEIDPGRGTAPIVFSGQDRCYVPLASLVKMMDGAVIWNPNNKSIEIGVLGKSIKLRINSSKAQVNNTWVRIDREDPKVTPILWNARTMVPIRFIAESIGCNVEWDPEYQFISITY
jgi:minor extracellular serine protease Vpr